MHIFASSIGGVSAAWLSLVTAILVIVGHVMAAYSRRRNQNTTEGKISEVHVLVNGRFENALKRLRALEEARKEAPDDKPS